MSAWMFMRVCVYERAWQKKIRLRRHTNSTCLQVSEQFTVISCTSSLPPNHYQTHSSIAKDALWVSCNVKPAIKSTSTDVWLNYLHSYESCAVSHEAKITKNTQTSCIISGLWGSQREHGLKGSNSDVKKSLFHKGRSKKPRSSILHALLLQFGIMEGKKKNISKLHSLAPISNWDAEGPLSRCLCNGWCWIWMIFCVNPQSIHRLQRHIHKFRWWAFPLLPRTT